MALINYFRQRGYPGTKVILTDEDGGTPSGTVIPAFQVVDGFGNPTGSGSTANPTIATNQGTANIASSQVSVGTTATQIVAARATRQAVTITNITGAQQIYVGPAGVTAATGSLLPATVGASITIPTTAAVFGIALTASQTVSALETY